MAERTVLDARCYVCGHLISGPVTLHTDKGRAHPSCVNCYDAPAELATLRARVEELERERDAEAKLSGMLLSWAASNGEEPDLLVTEWQNEKARAERAEDAFEIANNMRLEATRLAVEACRLLERYRTETPLGHQPHMIAHEVDAFTESARALASGESISRIINAERGKELAPDPATVERVAIYLAAQHSPDIADAVRVRFRLEQAARRSLSTKGEDQ